MVGLSWVQPRRRRDRLDRRLEPVVWRGRGFIVFSVARDHGDLDHRARGTDCSHHHEGMITVSAIISVPELMLQPNTGSRSTWSIGFAHAHAMVPAWPWPWSWSEIVFFGFVSSSSSSTSTSTSSTSSSTSRVSYLGSCYLLVRCSCCMQSTSELGTRFVAPYISNMA